MWHLRSLLLMYAIIYCLLKANIIAAAVFNIAPGDTRALIKAFEMAGNNRAFDTINLSLNSNYYIDTVYFQAIDGNTPQGPVGFPKITNDVEGTDIIINGNGASIIRNETGPLFRFFYLESNAELWLNNLTLLSGHTNFQGGAIFLGYKGKLTIYSCTFRANTSSWPNEGGGGAIYAKSLSTIYIQNSTFTGNRAGLNGGAINNLLSNLTILDCAFSDNQTFLTQEKSAGGAIYIDGAKADTGKIRIERCQFLSNKTGFQGGAIFSYLYNRQNITIKDCSFRSNVASGYKEGEKEAGSGGAIWFQGGELSLLPEFTGGPANAQLILSNSTLAENNAGSIGGAVYIGKPFAQITNSTFWANRATDTSLKAGLGGCFFINEPDRVSFTNLTIAENYAGAYGGGIFSNSKKIFLNNCIISNNKAGNIYKKYNNCSSSYFAESPNLEFPQRNLSDPTDVNCVDGILIGDPLLLPLAWNGGLTETMALQAGSLAIDAGRNCPATDQRGGARLNNCDLGAVEFGITVNVELRKPEKYDFTIFPNPVLRSGVLNIEYADSLSAQYSDVYWYNSIGSLYQKVVLTSSKIQVPHLNGLYYLRIGDKTIKVIVE